MSIIRIATLKIPSGQPPPALATVFGQVQIDSTTNDIVRIRRMDDNGIAVRNLAFIGKMTSANFLPGITTVRGAKDSEHQIAALTTLVRGEGIEHFRF